MKTGANAVNEVRIVTKGRSAMMFVNGKQVVAINGFPPSAQSLIGLYGESDSELATWQFSDLVVSAPAP